MEAILQDFIRTLQLGEPQRFKNLEVFPLFPSRNGGPDFLTLKQALEQKKIVITETTESGSVPQLKVTNRGNEFVLLIDGEELMGAKQNRVLNTSILIKGQSEITIPVSCTEHGRWSYKSREFGDSQLVMAPLIRAAKMQSVTSSLKFDRSFRSDQGQVWEQIADLQAEARVASPTGAMKDVYTAKGANLDAYVEALPPLPGQRGLLVSMNGKIVGLDVVSRESAYRTFHTKLIKSYALDAERNHSHPASESSSPSPQQVLESTLTCTESRFESPGVGHDYRFESPSIAGSALVYEGTVVHLAFFDVGTMNGESDFSSFRRHRGFRRASEDDEVA